MKVGSTAVFKDITRRGTLPKETFINIVKMITIKKALNEIYKREDKGWVRYIQTLSAVCSPSNTIKNITKY